MDYEVDVTGAPMEITAQWDANAGGEYHAHLNGVEIWSDDGDNWMPCGDVTELPDGFAGARITLSGGPRDGEQVL